METAAGVPPPQDAPRRGPPAGARRPLLVLGLVLALLGSAPVLAGLTDREVSSAPIAIPVVLLVALFLAAEVFVIDVELRREVHSISLSEVPLVLGLFFVSPLALIVARLAGSGGGLLLHARRFDIKFWVNVASFFAEVALAVAVFSVVLGDADPIGPIGWIAAICAVVAADVVAATTVTIAVRVMSGSLPTDSWWAVVAGLGAALANTSVALVAVIVVWYKPEASWLLGAVAGVVFAAYRGYASLRIRYQSLETLQGFTRVVGRTLEIDSVMAAVLREARDLTRCERSEIMLVELESGRAGIRVTDDEDNGQVVAPLGAADSTDLLWARLVSGDRSFIATATTSDVRMAAHLVERHITNAMVAPLHGNGRIVGALMVANRLAEHTTFDPEQLRIFETLANHASVSLENGRLVDELRQEAATREYEALHDSLTGLPNRAYFLRALRRELVAEPPSGLLAVMLMDLDRFKEINDTLGHHDGDEVLTQIAARLLERVRSGDVVARLGGDEFAVMLPHVASESVAIERAREIHESVCRPMTIGGIELAVGISIGLAFAPEHGTDPTQLLQRSDVAMYVAKAERSGHHVYTSETDGHSRERLALAGELRDGIDDGQLVVHFQPSVNLRTGVVENVEALVRWRHPVRGLLFPDTFIPAAEHANMTWPLTRAVLEESILTRAGWSAAGIDLGMSVNIAARDLVDQRLLDEIRRQVDSGALPRGSLTLEITESQIMADPDVIAPVLVALRDLGVKVAIDDFGTGYSSLSSLRRLPIHEIKIDKSFVLGMCDDENDAVIVRSTAHLGRNLGLRVVAEGVEDVTAWWALHALGCEAAQGYFMSPPMAADDLLAWAAEWVPPQPYPALEPPVGAGRAR